MKALPIILPILLLFSNCNHQPELTASQKFDKIEVGMSLEKAMDIFELKDTIGKSYIHQYDIAEVDTTGENPIPIETGEFLKVLYIDFDSTYTFVVRNDTITKKIDNTLFEDILNSLPN